MRYDVRLRPIVVIADGGACAWYYLDEPIVFPHRTDLLNRIFKRIMNDEQITQYYLRHTFATVCQQFVRPDIVDIWMGDSSERLVGRVYTHFPDKFMKSEMDKVVFEF